MADGKAKFSVVGVAGRRLRVGQWHAGKVLAHSADPLAEGAHRPLVLLNGIGMNMEMLQPVASLLDDRLVLSFDAPGIGGSPDPIFPYTMQQMALTLAALLDRLDLPVVDVLGISWGGALAQQFAFQHRARTGRLVLAATAPGGLTMVPGNPGMVATMLDPMEYSVERTLRRNLAALYNGGGSERVSLNAAKAPTPLGWSYQLAAFAGWSSLPFLPLLDLPVLVMADEDDQLIPPTNAQVLHGAIPRSRLEMFKGGGHLFMLGRPTPFVEHLRAFLDQPDAA
ncbi:alpha/beta fold hydrolase [Novosphingobium sp. FKTRR1]|uniref:alpha/beta fold hydrolase n=1 Tax=Novosphingobium sp. FKTRR1 TaxID=2879118 RepID=UPI001CEFD9A9|nr:alpha/beta hydrolase [Novosphingobium sp. FKTRR1]